MSNFEFEVQNFKTPSRLCSKATLFLGRPILTRLFKLMICLPPLYLLRLLFSHSIHCLLTHHPVSSLEYLSYRTREWTSQGQSTGLASLTGAAPWAYTSEWHRVGDLSVLWDKKIIEYQCEENNIKNKDKYYDAFRFLVRSKYELKNKQTPVLSCFFIMFK